MLEDRTMLETDAFATKVELISTPRSPRLILKVLGYKGRVVVFPTPTETELGKPIGRARISRQSVAHQDHLA